MDLNEQNFYQISSHLLIPQQPLFAYALFPHLMYHQHSQSHFSYLKGLLHFYYYFYYFEHYYYYYWSQDLKLIELFYFSINSCQFNCLGLFNYSMSLMFPLSANFVHLCYYQARGQQVHQCSKEQNQMFIVLLQLQLLIHFNYFHHDYYQMKINYYYYQQNLQMENFSYYYLTSHVFCLSMAHLRNESPCSRQYLEMVIWARISRSQVASSYYWLYYNL